MCYTVRFVLSNILRLLFTFVTRLTFTKFDCVILMHWHVILIECKMTHVLLKSNTKINGQHTSMVYASVKLRLSCTVY